MSIEHVIIIGSGPAGWAAATYLARAQLNPLIFAGEKSGGQLMLTTEIENYPGFPEGILGPQLMADMRKQAERFGARVKDINVERVDFSHKPFRITAGGEEYQASAILMTTGAESVWLNVPGEDKFVGRGVSTCAVCDAAFFKGKKTFVIGGGDSAMEDTLALTKFADSVTVVHRRDSFRASKIMQERVLKHPKVKVMWNSAVKEIKGDTKVTGIVLVDMNTKKEQELPADGVFVAIGHKPATDFVKGAIELDEKGFIVTRFALEQKSLDLASKAVKDGMIPYLTMTSVEGVFAAGDVVDFKYKQAITAAGYGTMAALDIEKWLEESKDQS
ncbi:MAG: thioredoxin-disulfide reductase [Candidatus Pacebacteria bacterium RIFCSPHIGHO2_01_FULL_46_10]|nr:MAG: thioredoxin-disulfide reductase [Candidatus Pacebacteria bacterium RIFCSPHIGHO2_01_FULL_46_10]